MKKKIYIFIEQLERVPLKTSSIRLFPKYFLRSFLSVFLACIFRSYLTVLFVFLGYDLSIIPFFNYS